MKKILFCLLLLVSLCACDESGKEVINPDEKYMYIIDTISNNDVFANKSEFFDIDVEMSAINEGYAYYITIDNPRIAMYNIEAVAIEKDVDYTDKMAANVGVFEEQQYNIIPNQTNVNQGYVKGLVISGISANPETTLYLYVQFYNSDYSAIRSEYIRLNAKYEA